MGKKSERKEKFVKICKKVLPWLLGSICAIGGVIVGYKIIDSEPSINVKDEGGNEND